ncbi:hypothetical protein XA68_11838 [Ophiocordyceps unilateralis]|uniref:Uncharacterized protein n=1 Tax=Ophiocordyceps unilateralis TaxID=268505 RepID=A0A2A9PG13_OPHUN|nr:hypothetical protein XA68_11838 [Ophiocordyceps unilateralis]
MPPDVAVSSAAPAHLLALLASHLPSSLTLLRRLQSAARGIGTSPGARVFFISDDDDDVFTAAYADVSPGADAQTFIFSTVQNTARAEDGSRNAAQLTALLGALARLSEDVDCRRTNFLLGSLHSDVRALLEPSGRLLPRPSGLYDKWLFDVSCLPPVEDRLPKGMHWGRATLDDCVTVVSRSNIPRTPWA